jgi:transposase InsO family protein
MVDKVKFVLEAQAGEVSFRQLCEAYEVSRAEGYRVLQRFEKEELAGLVPRSRRPHHSPTVTPAAIVARVIEEKQAHPRWGPKKLRARLGRIEPERKWPSTTTIHRILRRNGLVQATTRRRRHRFPDLGAPFPPVTAPNEVWTTDFKGQFRMGNGRLCYPLTVGDLFSRFALKCRSLESTATDPVQQQFERLFREYGLPRRIRSDNGVPFASRSLCGLSRLAVWWIKLGIGIERIEPGQPQQNAEHERYHRTLKDETTHPPERTHRAQQRRFDAFVYEYDFERPHEALEFDVPADRYRPSSRRLPRRGEWPGLDSSCGFERRQVRSDGSIKWKGRLVFVSEVLVVCP